MKRFRHILEFFFLFVLNGVMLWFFRGYLNLLLGVMMVLLFLYSVISVHIGIRFLSVEIEIPALSAQAVGEMPYVEINVPFLVKIGLTNRCILPFVQARVGIVKGNVFLDEAAAEEEKSMAVRPLGKEECAFFLSSGHAGYIEMRTVSLTLVDILGMWPVRREYTGQTAGIAVCPAPVGDREFPVNDFQNGMDDAEESRMKGSDFSDVSQVRGYIPGDAVRDIHWKLTAKREHMMVKERVHMSSRKMMIVLCLSRPVNPERVSACDQALGILYGLGLFYMERRMPAALFYYSGRFREIREQLAEGRESWRSAVLQSVYDLAGDGGVESAFRNMYPGQGYVLVDERGIHEVGC